MLLVARLVLGVGEAPTVPAGWKAIGQWFPKQERGTATSIFDGCAKISNVIGIPIMAFLVTTFSWHAAFIFTGILSVAYLAIWWLLYLTPKEALAKGRLSQAEFDYNMRINEYRGYLGVVPIGCQSTLPDPSAI